METMEISFYGFITLISYGLLILMFFKIIFFINFASLHNKNFKKNRNNEPKFKGPLVSVIVPCFNEELTIDNCVKSLLRQRYSNIEILIVNDGSTDNTSQRALSLSNEASNVRILNKSNEGKASALNFGLLHSKGEIIVSMDADSIFKPDTIEQLISSFNDESVVAVSGNVKVANRKTLLGKHQAIEYVTGLTLQRRAFAELGCMQVISGAIGAFRKDKLLEIGGYSSDTIVEDMDVTIALAQMGYKIIYNPDAIAYTGAPESITEFIKQRYRWTYGGFQIAAKYRSIVFKRHLNKMGTVGMPYFITFPWVDVLVSLLLIYSIIHVSITGTGVELVIFYIFMSCIQAALIIFALIMDNENKKLVFLAGLDSLFYNHLISFVTIKAGIAFFLRKKASWNKLERKGENILEMAI